MNFHSKTVWIIGASSGIGKALAVDFARAGAKLVLSSRKIEALESVKKNCLQHTTDCLVIPLDLEENENYKPFVNQVIRDYKSIDYLIVNGGISQRSLVYETPMSIDRRLMEINYFGNIAITKALLPVMVRQQSGHIVVVSSIVGKFGFPLRSAYSASKHALHGFYETLRAEHKHDNIKVTLVLPGRVQTNISFNALEKDGNPHQQIDAGQARGIRVESCSKQIIKAISKEKKEVLIGGKELWMARIRKYFPALFYKIANKIESK